MTSIYNAGDFLVCFPLWTIGCFAPEVRGILQARHPSGSIAVVLFTDEDQARAFSRDRTAPEDFTLHSISDPASLLNFLTVIEQLGNTHVAFDPSAGTKAISFSISHLRSLAAGWVA
jgi:hypothetical protein